MEDNGGVGKKYLWCSAGSTCEFHGKEKLSWTVLEDHLMKGNSPVEPKSFDFIPPGRGWPSNPKNTKNWAEIGARKT